MSLSHDTVTDAFGRTTDHAIAELAQQPAADDAPGNRTGQTAGSPEADQPPDDSIRV